MHDCRSVVSNCPREFQWTPDQTYGPCQRRFFRPSPPAWKWISWYVCASEDSSNRLTCVEIPLTALNRGAEINTLIGIDRGCSVAPTIAISMGNDLFAVPVSGNARTGPLPTQRALGCLCTRRGSRGPYARSFSAARPRSRTGYAAPACYFLGTAGPACSKAGLRNRMCWGYCGPRIGPRRLAC